LNPNIIFFVVDSLREDRFWGGDRTTKTPFLDSIINSGTYFKNAFSSSEVTGTCLGNFFTGMYSYKTKMTLQNYNKNITTFFDLVKKNNYHLICNVPDLTWFHNLTDEFDEKDFFFCGNMDQDGLNDGIGEQILDKLSKKYSKPWFYYIHIQDLHERINVPKEFDQSQYGSTNYDKQVAFIDLWIKKIVENINLENTVLIISADHASHASVDNNFGQIPRIQKFMRKMKYVFPSLEPIGIRIFILLRNFVMYFQKIRMRQMLTDEELRSLERKGGTTLFDDVLHIPLFFIGKGIPINQKVEQLVSGVDLFPTLLALTNTKYENQNLDGRDLHQFLKNPKQEDRAVYIESGDIKEQKDGKVIGLRTTNYKYLRSKIDKKKNVSLYDMHNDKSEKNNIAKRFPDVVEQMEKILQLMFREKIISEKDKIREFISKTDKV